MYELMVIGRVGGDVDSLLVKIEKIMKDVQASSLTTQKLGKKALAYPIKKHAEAEYFLVNFEAPGEAIKAISDNLRLEQEAILRHLLIKTKESKRAASGGKKRNIEPSKLKADKTKGLESKEEKAENIKKPRAKAAKEGQEK